MPFALAASHRKANVDGKPAVFTVNFVNELSRIKDALTCIRRSERAKIRTLATMTSLAFVSAIGDADIADRPIKRKRLADAATSAIQYGAELVKVKLLYF